jgi:hypothetical protein
MDVEWSGGDPVAGRFVILTVTFVGMVGAAFVFLAAILHVIQALRLSAWLADRGRTAAT